MTGKKIQAPTATFRILTVGCKINQAESQRLREELSAMGYAEAAPGEPAALSVVNSCAVTHKAVADSRKAARAAASASPGSRLIVTGCAAKAARGELERGESPGEIVPGRAAQLTGLLPDFRGQKAAVLAPPGPGSRARAVLKVQDGCSAACAFCIVPRARGGPSSIAAAEAIGEARALLDAGHGEIVVSGVNLGQYASADAPDFWDLVRKLNDALAPEFADQASIRLSSLDPGLLTDKALAVLAGAPMVAPHLHLSLQSGDARTLARMGRKSYAPSHVAAWLYKLREIWPVFALGADLLTGFPGETDEEAADTYAFVRALPLTYAHVFPYSPRPGTVAAKMADQVPPPLAKKRAAALRALASRRKSAFAKTVSALSRLHVVVEDGETATGRCDYYLECIVEREPGRTAPRPGQRIAVTPAGLSGTAVLVRRVR